MRTKSERETVEEQLAPRWEAEETYRNLDIGDGWLSLVQKLDNALQTTDPEYTLGQVKQKFRGLRFYTSWLSEEGRAYVSAAEAESYKTCETCGHHGGGYSTRPNMAGWLVTSCAVCADGPKRLFPIPVAAPFGDRGEYIV